MVLVYDDTGSKSILGFGKEGLFHDDCIIQECFQA